MQVTICLSGLEVAEFAKHVCNRLPSQAELILLYVIDTRPAEELNFARKTHLFGARTGANRQQQMHASEQTLAQEILNEAAAVFSGSQFQLKEKVTLVGRPEEQIIRYVREHSTDLLVMGVRYKSDLKPAPPGHLGPVARFIIDHTPCDLLIIR